TKTPNAPLDVEAEMQAVLDAVGEVAGHPRAQVRILEVASLAQIRDALRRDRYHVLHLSAHGSAEAVELEDEDGNPVTVTADALKAALRQAGRPVPLIVLSSCSGGSAAAQAMAAAMVPAGGRSVRELPMGTLIGRRKELRIAMGVLRRTPAAERDFGAASGVVLTGIGGIGKTALAGRVISRLREDGWLIAVH